MNPYSKFTRINAGDSVIKLAQDRQTINKVFRFLEIIANARIEQTASIDLPEILVSDNEFIIRIPKVTTSNNDKNDTDENVKPKDPEDDSNNFDYKDTADWIGGQSQDIRDAYNALYNGTATDEQLDLLNGLLDDENVPDSVKAVLRELLLNNAVKNWNEILRQLTSSDFNNLLEFIKKLRDGKLDFTGTLTCPDNTILTIAGEIELT